MEEDFQIVSDLIDQTNDETISSIIEENFQKILGVERRLWKILLDENETEENFDFFEKLCQWNQNLVFSKRIVSVERKISLLVPEPTESMEKLISRIESTVDPNAPFLLLLNLSLENLGFLIHEYDLLKTNSFLEIFCLTVGQTFVSSESFHFDLKKLAQPQIDPSVFTARQRFNLVTSSFLCRLWICSKADRNKFRVEQILETYRHDYFQMLFNHHENIERWSKDFLKCVAHLVDLFCAACWWNDDRPINIHFLSSTGQIFDEHVKSFISILGQNFLYRQIESKWCNDYTVLVDSILIFLLGALMQEKNLSCFIRVETNLSIFLLQIAEVSLYDRISMCAYGILAEILSDKQLKEVQVTDQIFAFFCNILEQAWKHPDQRYKRIGIPQLLRGFSTLSKNDVIQRHAAQKKCYALLIDMMDQYPVTIDILWAFSFNLEIQKELRSNATFMSKLRYLANHSDSVTIRKATNGIIWNLDTNHQELGPVDSCEQPQYDIMISYSHKDEEICKKIYERLVEKGYRVWIDFLEMRGNIIISMARGIEQSRMVLVCMSEQYRRSNYCRAEAHYAFQRNLKLVPILLQEHYQPDGWLSFLLGQLLFVDFTKQDFDRSMDLLIKEINQPDPNSRGENLPRTTYVPTNDAQRKNPTTHVDLPKNPNNWTQQHVRSWLIEQDIPQFLLLFKDFDGRSLISVFELIEAGDMNQSITLLKHDCLRKLNQNLSLLELARFRASFKQLIPLPSSENTSKRAPRSRKHLPSCRLM